MLVTITSYYLAVAVIESDVTLLYLNSYQLNNMSKHIMIVMFNNIVIVYMYYTMNNQT